MEVDAEGAEQCCLDPVCRDMPGLYRLHRTFSCSATPGSAGEGVPLPGQDPQHPPNQPSVSISPAPSASTISRIISAFVRPVCTLPCTRSIRDVQGAYRPNARSVRGRLTPSGPGQQRQGPRRGSAGTATGRPGAIVRDPDHRHGWCAGGAARGLPICRRHVQWKCKQEVADRIVDAPIRKRAMMCALMHEDEQGVLTRRNQGDSEQLNNGWSAQMAVAEMRRKPTRCDGSHGAPRRQFDSRRTSAATADRSMTRGGRLLAMNSCLKRRNKPSRT